MPKAKVYKTIIIQKEQDILKMCKILTVDQIWEAEIEKTVQNDPWVSGLLNRLDGGISH